MLLPTQFTYRPYNSLNFAIFFYRQYPAFCTSYDTSQLIKITAKIQKKEKQFEFPTTPA
jgi:hypothetical protein